MKFLSLFSPKNPEELEDLNKQLVGAKTLLTVLKERYITRRINEIDRCLDMPEKYDKPGYDRYISGLLSARIELKKIRAILTFEEKE